MEASRGSAEARTGGEAAVIEWTRGPYRISTDPERLDVGVVHGFLTESYWARGIPRGTVERSIAAAVPFGLYRGDEQIGFARVVSDRATFAYLCDVFVLPPFRRQGLARWLCETALGHPGLQGIRRWLLVTRDAHPLYDAVGFTALAAPEMYMEIHDPDVYRRSAAP